MATSRHPDWMQVGVSLKYPAQYRIKWLMVQSGALSVISIRISLPPKHFFPAGNPFKMLTPSKHEIVRQDCGNGGKIMEKKRRQKVTHGVRIHR